MAVAGWKWVLGPGSGRGDRKQGEQQGTGEDINDGRLQLAKLKTGNSSHEVLWP